MVCKRCIKVVRDEFVKLNLTVQELELGRVTVASQLSSRQIEAIRLALESNDFELILDKKSQLIDQIKTIIIEKIHYSQNVLTPINSSDYIAQELGYDYSYLSHLFSSTEGITIEKYIINQKIEKVKELIAYNELSLNEIAFQLGYSSVQHLSGQFKKVTGMTPSNYKKLQENSRIPLDEI
jgi:AraC-like DNA-binding protein